jgi:hypothetical protein
MSETPWKKILIAGIGAAGAAAILYYLMKEEPKKEVAGTGKQGRSCSWEVEGGGTLEGECTADPEGDH